MHSPGINGEGELRGQPANPGPPGKMAVKTECVCVCVAPSVVTAIFPDGPGLSGARMSPFVILLELRVMEVVMVTTAAIRLAKRQSNRHHRPTNTPLFTGWMSFL